MFPSAEPTSSDAALASRLQEALTGSWMAQALHVAADLGIADHLRDSAQPPSVLSAATGANEEALGRLLKALCTIDICREREDGAFEMTALGSLLARDHPHSLRSWVLWWGRHLWPVWGQLLYSVRTGQGARALLEGTEGFEHLNRDAEAAAVFYQVTVELTRLSASFVVNAYDFSGLDTIVDVGGGHGELLAAILERHRSARGILFDMAAAMDGARQHFARVHPSIGGRCTFTGGDFFDSIPGGADAYLLKSVIHDWDDERSARILETCRRAMAPHSRLLLIEQILPERREVSPLHQMLSRHDLTMLVACGAQERTEAEYRRLLDQAGLVVTAIVQAGPSFAVIDAKLRQ